MKTKQFTFRTTEQLLEAIKKAAEQDGRKPSNFVEWVLYKLLIKGADK